MGLAKALIVNILLGLVVLFLLNALTPLAMGYLWYPLILSAIGGIPGALLAVVIHLVIA